MNGIMSFLQQPPLPRIISENYEDAEDDTFGEGQLIRVKQNFLGTNHVHLSVNRDDVVKIVAEANMLGWCEVELVLTRHGIPPYEGQKRRGYILKSYLAPLKPEQDEYFKKIKERNDRNEKDKQEAKWKGLFASKNKNLDEVHLKGPRHRFTQSHKWSFRHNSKKENKENCFPKSSLFKILMFVSA